MSERKVLNKYYPPDFDPGKIKRIKHDKARQYTVRIMAPCNMRCNTCHDYIARGKKFNARKETVDGEEYLKLKIFRFYFRCPVCMQEITFKTDPKSFDYVVESGATPNFKALKLAHQQANEEQKAIEEEEKLNPVKMLENRTLASRREMENLEALEDLREINLRSIAVNHEELLKSKQEALDDEIKRQEEEDEAYVQSIYGSKRKIISNRLSTIPEDGDDDDGEKEEEESEEIEEEIESIFDLYPQFKSEINASKPEADDNKKCTDSISGGVQKSNYMSKLKSAIIKKRPIQTDDANTSQAKVMKTDSSSTSLVKATSGPDITTSGQSKDSTASTSALSLLGAYSDSENSD